MLPILIFLLAHWYLSAFSQSFFLHRYGAHRQFEMSLFWERVFHLLTFVSQGASYLNPRAYALLHREHHQHSDTEDDPHSPHFFKDVVSMMVNTAHVYMAIKRGTYKKSGRDLEGLPVWPLVDRIGDSPFTRLAFVVAYIAFYVHFAPSAWWFLLLPIHIVIGPIHGAFVNWCGHKYGYATYDNKDHSKNTFPWDILFMGECFQNNHHRHPNSPNFARRWFEFDMLYPSIKLLHALRVIRIKHA